MISVHESMLHMLPISQFGGVVHVFVITSKKHDTNWHRKSVHVRERERESINQNMFD
jgi:hypothetical protein